MRWRAAEHPRLRPSIASLLQPAMTALGKEYGRDGAQSVCACRPWCRSSGVVRSRGGAGQGGGRDFEDGRSRHSYSQP
jgi:hypothetical protein